jgi:hypothetical protein
MTEDKIYHPRALTLDDFGSMVWATTPAPRQDKVDEVVVSDGYIFGAFMVEACGRGFKWPFSVPEHTVLVAKEKEL